MQVLHKQSEKFVEYEDWFVIQECITYKPKMLKDLFDKITKDLLSLDNYTEDWRKVFRCLPEKINKYLEDEGGE